MQEPITQSNGPSASSNSQTALIAGAALIGGAALLAQPQTSFAQPRTSRAVSPAVTYAQIPGSGDFKPLNFALALELIEADLYGQAVQRMTTGGTNALGQTITGLNTPASDLFVQYLREFGQVEREHRDFLLQALGSNAISNSLLRGAKFDFNINNKSATQLLDFLIAVEDTGVEAYIGAVPQFSVRSQYLPTAAAIQGTEARHTAALTVVRNRLYGVQGDTANRKSSTAPQANENGGRDGIIREGSQAGAVATGGGTGFLDTVLAGVSPFIVLPTT